MMNSLLAVKSIDRKKKSLSSGRNNNDSISVPRLVITQSPVFTLNFDDKLLSNHDNIRSFTGQNKLSVIARKIKRKHCLSFPLSFPWGGCGCNLAIQMDTVSFIFLFFSSSFSFYSFFVCFLLNLDLST